MDNTMFIINPIEEINYLFEYIFHITAPTATGTDKQKMSEEKELEVMMEGVSLDERMQEQKLDNLLMYSPRSITDYSKFQWMRSLGQDQHKLMGRSKGRWNNYLNSLLHVINDKTAQNWFEFIEMYPHSRNLAAKCAFKQGEVILQIKQEWIMGNRNLPKTYFMKYLQAIISAVVQGKIVFRTSGLSNQEGYIYQIRKVQKMAISIYLFEKKFITEIIQCPFTSTKKQAFEWLYFKLLPQNFDYHPIREWQSIKSYHKDLAHHLQRMEYEFIQEYKLIKKLVDGQYIKDEFSFCAFLKTEGSNGLSIYDKYQRFFTPKNYIWAKLCQKTRLFQINNYQHAQNEYTHEEQIGYGSKKKLIPFLDLIYHSTSTHNIDWEYDPKTGNVILRAEKEIKQGDLLYIKYKNITINSCYIDYGFVDAREVGWVDLNLYINFDIVQYVANELYQKKIKRSFINFIQNYCLSHDLQAEVRIIDYTVDTYHDHLIKKQTVLQDVIDAYTELTLFLLNKHDPQMRKKCYLHQAQIMRSRVKKMMTRMIVTSLERNIEEKRSRIEKVERDLTKAQKNWNRPDMKIEAGRQVQRMNDMTNQAQRRAEYVKQFNSLYHFTCIKTILSTELKILQKMLYIFEHKGLKRK